MGFRVGGGTVLGFSVRAIGWGGSGGRQEKRRYLLTQPRFCMRGHHTFVASSSDVAGRIMHSEDSVGDAIVGRSEELCYEYSADEFPRRREV